MRGFLACLSIALAACGQERIEVSHEIANDYNHGKLQTAIDKFVAAGRTPQAFAELSQTVFALRPGMDRSVAEQAELRVLVLALDPVKAMAQKPMTEQVDALALTVWPTLLTDEIEADEILRKRDEKAAELMPKPGEDAHAYLQRLCGTRLAADCKQVVPEFQGHILHALVTRRATERVRNAVADCMMCSTEPGWKEAVRGWEALDHDANMWLGEIERKADPINWPIAGAASEKDPNLPEAEVTATGEIIIGGQRYGATTRIDALRDLKFMGGNNADDAPIALHLRPELSLAQTKGILADIRKAGIKKVAIIARAPQYPWDRRIYWLSDVTGTRAGLRPTDTLQLLLHAIDHLAEPGAVARVD
ncbi:MAG TPA: hypothetical protein VFQ53_00060 [Kofleriaceae bacterium]|nr:hypothetical protein [Kofleriaceae bacterium]